MPASAGPVTAGDLLTLEELGHLRRTSALRGAALVLHAWGVIAGAISLYVLWPSALTLGAVLLVVGGRQLGLMVLMHETSHWLLFPRPALNTWVGSWLCAAPLGQDLKAYRRRHHLHHRHTRTADDPDLPLVARLPTTRARLALSLLGDLLGWTALTRLGAWRPWRDGRVTTGRVLLVQGALLAGLTALGGVTLYGLVWLLPWATWFQVVTRIRDIAEHGAVSGGGDPLRDTRTTGAGLLARAFLAPYSVNHHLEHHLLVFVPCWKLRQARALLLAKGLGGRMEQAASYKEVLIRGTTGT